MDPDSECHEDQMLPKEQIEGQYELNLGELDVQADLPVFIFLESFWIIGKLRS